MNTKIKLACGLALLFATCTSTPQPNAALGSARAAVQADEADPNASRYAALALQSAKNDFAVAGQAAAHHGELQIAHPAYLAAQTARLSQERASAKSDDATVAAGQVERDQIQLAARNREAEKARIATDVANAESARLKAEMDTAAADFTVLRLETKEMTASIFPAERYLDAPTGDSAPPSHV